MNESQNRIKKGRGIDRGADLHSFLTGRILILVFLTIILSSGGCKIAETIGQAEGMINRQRDSLIAALPTIGSKTAGGAINGILDTATNPPQEKKLGRLVTGISSQLVRGAIDSLAQGSSRAKLDTLASQLASAFMKGAEDSLMTPRTRRWVQSQLHIFSDTTRKLTADLRDSILGIRTRELVGEFLKDPAVVAGLTQIRDSLLGQGARKSVQELIDSSVASIGRGYKAQLSGLVRGDLSYAERNAGWLLATAGVVLAGLFGIYWYEKNRYTKMLVTMMRQIDRIPDQHIYDELVSRISDDAMHTGVEPGLRSILHKSGINKSDVPGA